MTNLLEYINQWYVPYVCTVRMYYDSANVDCPCLSVLAKGT